jgi:hypothetical protein
MAEASLRTSINQSGVQILYLPVPDSIKKKVKVFMDVTVERLGDAVAAVLILFLTLVLGLSEVTLLSYFSVGLIVIWIAVVLTTHKGYVDTLRRSLAHHEVSLAEARLDFADTATAETVLGALDGMDEQSVLFGLDLAEKINPQHVVARLPRSLLSYPSPEVRRRALTLVASSLDSNVLAMLFELLTSERTEFRLEAINTLATVMKAADIPAIRPLLRSPEVQTRRAAMRLLFQSGDAQARQEALTAFRDLVMDFGSDGERSRIEAARLMGELAEPVFADPLSRLIKDDPSPAVVREAMLAAASGKYPAVIPEVISRLSGSTTKTAAREALIQYGEMAVKGLRSTLADGRIIYDCVARLYQARFCRQSAALVLSCLLSLRRTTDLRRRRRGSRR